MIFQPKSDFFTHYDHTTQEGVANLFLDEMGKFEFHWIYWTILHKSPSEAFKFSKKGYFDELYSLPYKVDQPCKLAVFAYYKCGDMIYVLI